jgi:hypothetical protein
LILNISKLHNQYNMNLSKILEKLTKKISDEIKVSNNGAIVNIELTNVATLNDGDEFMQEKSSIIISVVNIEEDKTLKNQTLYKEYTSGNSIEKYKKPAQNLILSLLFTSYNKDQALYADGLDKLEYVIKYLQYNNVFYYDNTNFLEQTTASENDVKSMNKIILDLVSLKSDQLNQMWSYLGSKYMPSVLYTMRLIHIQHEDNLPTDPIIDKAKVQMWTTDKNDIAGEIEANSFLLE